MLMAEKFVTFSEYKEKCRVVNITSNTSNTKTRDEIIKESQDIISSFRFEKEVM